MSVLLTSLHSIVPWLLYVLLLALVVAGLFLNILGLPGLWLIVIAAIAYGWWFGFAFIGWWTIAIVVLLGVLAELVEFLAGAAGSKKAGGSKRGMVGAIVGGLVGGIVGTPLIPVPVVGTIIGSVVGCFVGAYAIEWMIGRSHGEAATISLGAAKGRVVGLVAKTAFGLAMAMLVAIMGVPFNWWAASATANTPATTPSSLPTTAP